jgi:hypothetical protein
LVMGMSLDKRRQARGLSGKKPVPTWVWPDPTSIQGDGRVDRTPVRGEDSKTNKLSWSSSPSFTNEQWGNKDHISPLLVHSVSTSTTTPLPSETHSSRPQRSVGGSREYVTTSP